jgi:eukaryotic-like serine/threonine-protein kinase
MMNLANTYVMQGRLADARRILDRVREIVKRAFRPNSEEWAHYHLSAGELDSEQGRDAESLEHYEEAARLHRTLTGPESPDALQSLVRVAEAQMSLERLNQAQQTFQQVLELTKKDSQQEHIYTQALSGLATLHAVRGQHDKALRLRQQVLELRERFLGSEHFNTSLIRMDIANTQLELGQPARALAIFEQVRALFEKTAVLDSPVGALLMAGRGEALRKLGRATEAIPLLERALQVVADHKGRPEYQATVQSALARALRDARQPAERVLKLATAARATYARTPLLRANELAQLDAVLKRYAPKEPPPGTTALPAPP